MEKSAAREKSATKEKGSCRATYGGGARGRVRDGSEHGAHAVGNGSGAQRATSGSSFVRLCCRGKRKAEYRGQPASVAVTPK